MRRQLADLSIAEHRSRLAEQVAELLDRDRLDVVLRQVGLDELGEREPTHDPSLPPKPLELTLECVTRVLLGGEPATLDALGVAAACPVTVRPQPFTALVRLSVLAAASLRSTPFASRSPPIQILPQRGLTGLSRFYRPAIKLRCPHPEWRSSFCTPRDGETSAQPWREGEGAVAAGTGSLRRSLGVQLSSYKAADSGDPLPPAGGRSRDQQFPLGETPLSWREGGRAPRGRGGASRDPRRCAACGRSA